MSEIIKVKISSKEAKKDLFEFVQGKEAGLRVDNDELWDWVENDNIRWEDDTDE